MEEDKIFLYNKLVKYIGKQNDVTLYGTCIISFMKISIPLIIVKLNTTLHLEFLFLGVQNWSVECLLLRNNDVNSEHCACGNI